MNYSFWISSACVLYVHNFFATKHPKWLIFHIYWHINYFVKLFMCSYSPPVGEAINCESVIEMRMYIDAAPVCFLGCHPSAPSLRGVHSNAFVIIIKNRSTFSSTQIYNCCRQAGIWPMTCSSSMKKSVITFSSFAIPSGSWVHFSVNAVYPIVWRIFLRSNDLLITLRYSH